MELLKVKIQKKKSNPKFTATRANEIKRVPVKWRKPPGKQNKIRLCKAGRKGIVRVGYGTPAELRDSTKEGKKIIIVNSKDELLKVDKDSVAIIANIGDKKRLELLKLAKEKSINIYNIKVDDAIKKIEESMKQRKTNRKSKKTRLKSTIVKADTKEKKEDKKEVKTEEKTKEEKTKEVEKILIHDK